MSRRTLELYYVENSYPSHAVGAGVTKMCSEETIKIVAVSSVHPISRNHWTEDDGETGSWASETLQKK